MCETITDAQWRPSGAIIHVETDGFSIIIANFEFTGEIGIVSVRNAYDFTHDYS